MAGIDPTTSLPPLAPVALPGEALRQQFPPELLASWVVDARQRTLGLIADLEDSQLLGPRLEIVNPLLWEIGHIAWFQEKWVLRRPGGDSVRPDADALYDSSAIPHSVRWDLPLPSRSAALDYLRAVQDRVLQILHAPLRVEDIYFVLLAVFHEDMHDEAFTYTRQTLGYPAPSGPNSRFPTSLSGQGACPGDVEISGGRFLLGALPGEPFVFDNEKWAHPVEVRPFRIAKAPVTQAEFLAFVEEGGYEDTDFWSEAGRSWREQSGRKQPLYQERQSGGRWLRRDFDRWVPLEPHRPILHVSWYEAEAYCRWARRRLPTEVEWELAAAGTPAGDGRSPGLDKRPWPWGDSTPDPERGNLDGLAGGCVDVAHCPAGDSAWGCRQMIGNVWEWTASDFTPYPGFVVDPYRDYSLPWFGTHKVLRGGCWVTRARLLRNTWRNFYRPERADVWAGFRTCALQP